MPPGATLRIVTIIALGFSIAGCNEGQKDSRQNPDLTKTTQQNNPAPGPASHASDNSPAHASLNNSPLPQNSSSSPAPSLNIPAAPIGRGGPYAAPVLSSPGSSETGTSRDQGNTGQFELGVAVPTYVEQTMRTFAMRFPDSMMTTNDTRNATGVAVAYVPDIIPVIDPGTSGPGHKVRGAPGPLMGATGLPVVAAGYVFYLLRRRRIL